MYDNAHVDLMQAARTINNLHVYTLTVYRWTRQSTTEWNPMS